MRRGDVMTHAALMLAAAIAAAAGVGEQPALADVVGASQSVTLNLDLAALLLAVGTSAAGFAAFRRLRAERPKIVEEVAALHEGRLRDALDAAWAEADRLRAARDRYASELTGCHNRIGELERREDELEGKLRELTAELRGR